MITEDYVSFETAKLLKEKGFGGILPYVYIDTKSDKKPCLLDTLCNYNDGHIKDVISAPTLQMAMKWLREVHKIGVFPSTYTNIMGTDITHVYGTAIVNLNTYELMTNDCMGRDTFNEAVEAAIKYCLENLI